ncbi:MAG TPA: acyl carrier protein [Woeseiaceae bacterium]|jgi:acyl carrier protein|nr:acyl carrier protein [Woeseiaceae bacterium]
MSETIKLVMSQVFQIDPAAITAESSPESIERWDSLKHMQLIMALEDELGVQFPDDAIPELVSYGAIEQMVQELTAP